MATETLSRESAEAVKYFETKLAFEITPIGLERVLKQKEPIQIIDMRTPELYAQGHIPGALNIQYEELEKSLPKLSKEKVTVAYCYDITCHLAAKTALALAQKGYKVKELFGGWQSWVEHKLPVEGKTQAQSCSSHSSPCG